MNCENKKDHFSALLAFKDLNALCKASADEAYVDKMWFAFKGFGCKK
jgi:hypothetical protein